MKRLFCLWLIITILGITAPIFANETDISLPLSTLYELPNADSKVVLQIPMDVRILDISEDANWYQVKISYDFGLLGKNTYLGWVYAPVGNALEARKALELVKKP